MLAKGMQSNGGIAYGYDFEYAPDADDTGLLLVVLSKFGSRYAEQIKKSKAWLHTMQNPDGGFPAFDTNKMENQLFFKYAMNLAGISNSAEIFDPSSPDVTTHIMEGLAATGEGLNNTVVKHSIGYLKKSQASYGSWQARWGVNYVYSMGCVIPGLARIGYNLNETWIRHSVDWLKARQNADGGFGETVRSYNDPDRLNGRGVSTVSQTAWGLLALIEVVDLYDTHEHVERAVAFLLAEFKRLGDQFIDISVVGTGHRGVLYL
jgi:squalene-hopene/tetraprenyl-beta-curcumene cyclase